MIEFFIILLSVYIALELQESKKKRQEDAGIRDMHL